MLIETGLTFREITMNDPLPKGTIQQAVIEFLKDRESVERANRSHSPTGEISLTCC
ncbi:MAG TPA: hypothetical protein VFW73_07400 [Lacipirellulaceae bacterium]|nr:hypothetical protein [Lacipirellulaceae bacterium]